MNLVLVGASAGLGRCLAEEAARRGHSVFLVASDARDLAALAADLQLRYGVRAGYAACRFGGAPEDLESLAAAVRAFGTLDGLLYPMGTASERDAGALDPQAAEQLVRINFLSQVWLTTALWPVLTVPSRACVVGFGSIAAIRGRRRNVVYAAAKRALLSYFESLRHLAAGTGIRVHFYQLGYLDTQQTFGKQLLFPKADPVKAARFVLDHLDADHGPAFYPGYWRAIAWMLRRMPWFLYRRLDF